MCMFIVIKNMHREGIRYFTFISCLLVYLWFALISEPRKISKAQSLSLNFSSGFLLKTSLQDYLCHTVLFLTGLVIIWIEAELAQPASTCSNRPHFYNSLLTRKLTMIQRILCWYSWPEIPVVSRALNFNIDPDTLYE